MLEEGLILPQLIARRAELTPDRTFIQHVDGSEITYSALHAQALRWASGLVSLGVEPKHTVLTMLPNGIDAVAAWLAAAWSGGWEVPVNNEYRGRLLAYLINNSTARTIITTTEFLERILDVRGELETLRNVVVVDAASTHEAGELRILPRSAIDDNPVVDFAGPRHCDIATIVYTSGTTGPSKGVLMPWAQCHAMSTGCIPLDDLGPDDAWYVPFPLYHMSGKHALYAAALTGARFVTRRQFSTNNFWNEVKRYDCAVTLLIGTTASFIGGLPAREDDADNPLTSVLMAPLPADAEAFKKRFGIRIATVFNMTEISSPIRAGFDLHGRSCGRLRDGYEVRIVDDEDEEVPTGEAGEIIVRSRDPWVLNVGYYNMPDKTAEAWRNGWFHTGDFGKIDSGGNFYYLDRKKDALRRRGENISSMELEAVISDCPGVVECAVIGVPSEVGEDEVKTCLVATSDFRPEQLIAYLAPLVPRFMIPRFVEIMDALPKTPTEKVRKDALRTAGVNAATWDREREGLVLPK